MKENSINLLVQKLLASDWNEMDFKLFEQLVKETGIHVKEVLEVANLYSDYENGKEQHR